MLHSVMKSLVDTENMNLNVSFFHNNNKYLLTGYLQCARGFPGGSDSKESACNVGDPGLIPGSGRSPGEENGLIPWIEDPGGLQSMGLQRVRHN